MSVSGGSPKLKLHQFQEVQLELYWVEHGWGRNWDWLFVDDSSAKRWFGADGVGKEEKWHMCHDDDAGKAAAVAQEMIAGDG